MESKDDWRFRISMEKQGSVHCCKIEMLEGTLAPSMLKLNVRELRKVASSALRMIVMNQIRERCRSISSLLEGVDHIGGRLSDLSTHRGKT